MEFSALIFDFNGLIVDDEGIHYECFRRVLLEEDITLAEKDYWDKYLGFDDKGLIQVVFGRDGKKIPPKKLKMLVEKKSLFYLPILKERFVFFPGVVDFIRKAGQKYLLAIVSGALRHEIDFVLEAGRLDKAFMEIVSAEDTKHGKPDPEGYVIALARLKAKMPEVRPGNCLALEDSHAGIEAAHRAGMKVMAVTHTYPRDSLKDADFVVDDFESAARLLGLY